MARNAKSCSGSIGRKARSSVDIPQGEIKMSRIGKKPVEILQGVEVKIDGQTVTAKGPLGTEVVNVRPEIAVKIEDNHVVLSKVGTSRETDALYGL